MHADAVPLASGGAAAIVFDGRARVLLVKENYDRRRFSLPGGALEDGETPEDAVVRETREETGVEVAVDHLVGRYTLDNGFTAYAFRCTILAGVPSVQNVEEIAWVGWHPSDDLPTPRSNILHDAVPDALAGHRGVVRTDLPRVS